MAWEISIYVDKYGKPDADPPPGVNWRWEGKIKKIATVVSRKQMFAVVKACKQRGFHGIARNLSPPEKRRRAKIYAQVRNLVDWRSEMAFRQSRTGGPANP